MHFVSSLMLETSSMCQRHHSEGNSALPLTHASLPLASHLSLPPILYHVPCAICLVHCCVCILRFGAARRQGALRPPYQHAPPLPPDDLPPRHPLRPSNLPAPTSYNMHCTPHRTCSSLLRSCTTAWCSSSPMWTFWEAARRSARAPG